MKRLLGTALSIAISGLGLVASCGNSSATHDAAPPDAGTNPTDLRFGPFGGYVTALASDARDPDVIYAGTWGGTVFKSLDAGASWAELSDGLPIYRETTLTFPSVVSIAADGNTLFAGTDGDGVFRSSDGGAHWTAASTGLPEQSIARVRADGATIYAAVSVLGGRGGVYRSQDGGATWQSVLGDEFISDVAIDPSDPSVLYAVAPDSVFKSINAGQSWQTLALQPQPANTWFDNVGAAAQAVFVGGSYRFGLYESANAGQAWEPAGLTDATYQVVLAGGDLYAAASGVAMRKANQTQWAHLGPSVPIRSLVFDPQSGSMLAGSYHRGEGILAVSETGSSERNQGLANRSCHALAVTSNGGNTVVFAGTDLGVARTADDGVGWDDRAVAPTWQDSDVASVAVESADVVYASNSSYRGGVSRSSDGGRTFTAANQGLASTIVTSLVFEPTRGVLYAVVEGDGPDLPGGVYRSGDGATTWTSTGLPYPGASALAIAPSNADRMYAAASSDIYRSDDGAVEWRRAASLTDLGFGIPEITALAVDPTTPTTLYVAIHDLVDGRVRLLRSDNGAAAWSPVLEVPGVSPISSILVEAPETLFVGTRAAGVYSSTDGGSSWRSLGLAGHAVTAIARDPRAATTLYAATLHHSIFVSRDNGETWR